MKNSLLERVRAAKTSKNRRHPDPEELDVALAWVRGEVSSVQVGKGYDPTSGNKQTYNILYRMATVLRDAATNGKIKIEKL